MNDIDNFCSDDEDNFINDDNYGNCSSTRSFDRFGHETRVYITDTTSYVTDLYLILLLNMRINTILLNCCVYLLMGSL